MAVVGDVNGFFKGQGLVAITGRKGSGKSHFATSGIKFIRDNFPDHPVYSDIEGINIEGVLPSPDNWMDLPDNSTVFYDEAQRLEWADNSSSKINSDARIREMTMIRHRNINVVVMTQDPTFIHSALRKLVDVHYHISHPFKDGKPKVFIFSGMMNTIDDKGAYKSHAVETFTHKLDGDTSKLYKSVNDGASHDQKKKIPKRIVYMIGAVVAIVLLGIPIGLWGVNKVYSFIGGADDRGAEMLNNAENSAATISGGAAVDSGFKQAEPMTNNEQLSQTELDSLYKKYLDDYTIEVAEHDAIRPASIMAMNGRCMAYNKFGDGLDVTQDKCNDMLANPDTIPKARTVRQFKPNAMASGGVPAVPANEQPTHDYINNPPPPVT